MNLYDYLHDELVSMDYGTYRKFYEQFCLSTHRDMVSWYACQTTTE